jgi:hypothetical protein
VKHIKTYEAIWRKNLIPGEIYIIDKLYISKEGQHNVEVGKIISVDEYGYHVDLKTFLSLSHKEYIFKELEKRWIKRKANPEEIKKYEYYEMLSKTDKYNL